MEKEVRDSVVFVIMQHITEDFEAAARYCGINTLEHMGHPYEEHPFGVLDAVSRKVTQPEDKTYYQLFVEYFTRAKALGVTDVAFFDIEELRIQGEPLSFILRFATLPIRGANFNSVKLSV